MNGVVATYFRYWAIIHANNSKNYFTSKTETNIVVLYDDENKWYVAEWNFCAREPFKTVWMRNTWPTFSWNETLTCSICGILCANDRFIVCKTASTTIVIILEKSSGNMYAIKVCDNVKCSVVQDSLACFHPHDTYIFFMVRKSDKSYTTPLSIHVVNIQNQSYDAEHCFAYANTPQSVKYIGWEPVAQYASRLSE